MVGLAKIWSIYMVMGKDQKIYTGITTDIARRFEEHQGNGTKGAKFLRGRGPLTLMVVMPVGSQKHALRVEYLVKGFPDRGKKISYESRRFLSP